MIKVTRINHVPIILNCDLIEHVEVTPDTVISLTNGQKFMVLETPDEVIGRVVEFKRAINTGAWTPAGPEPEPYAGAQTDNG